MPGQLRKLILLVVPFVLLASTSGSANRFEVAMVQVISEPPSLDEGPTQSTDSPAAVSLAWPITGSISSYFGVAHPLGIDIEFHGQANPQIVAAASGTVAFAGGNICCSYGLYVVIRHGEEFETLYAHLSAIKVWSGQAVAQGQIVGNGGRTGNATGNHLHFEVHKGSLVVDPLSFLP